MLAVGGTPKVSWLFLSPSTGRGEAAICRLGPYESVSRVLVNGSASHHATRRHERLFAAAAIFGTNHFATQSDEVGE